MTLLEVLAAAAIFAIGCMAVMAMQVMSMNSGQRAAKLTTASFLAESQLEWVQSLDFNEVEFISQAPERLTRDGEICPAELPASSCYTRTVTVTLGATTRRSYNVSVQIDWQGLDGPQQIIYDTIVSDFGM
jgi:Tfp pilus assembly protein PilV